MIAPCFMLSFSCYPSSGTREQLLDRVAGVSHAVFRAHQSGLTPTTVNAQAIQLLRNDDRVGLRELVKVERREVFAVADSIVDEYQAVSSPSEEQATDIAERVTAAVLEFLQA